jgi:hypothetical protein
MTKLKSFGCSFVYGDDLRDTFKYPAPLWSTYTWPALLSRHLKLRYVCHAYPGAGNLQILDSLLKEVDDPEPAVYVISWTWIDRFDYTDPASTKWCTIRPTDTDSASQHYYRQLHSQYRDKLTTLTYISAAISALLACGHKFIMTYQDPLIFETKWHASPAIQTLQNYVNPHMTNFEGMSFLDWSQHHGHAISPAWHPLESAHRAAFEYIRDQSLV